MAHIDNPFETDEVVGVVPPAQSAELRRAASDAGFDVQLVCDPATIDIDGDRSDDSMFDTVLRFFQEGEEKDVLRQYHQRLVAGDHLIRLLSVGDRAEEAGVLMNEHGAQIVWHFGNWTYKPLPSS